MCTECDADVDVDEFDVDRNDLLSCADCGAHLRVAAISPVVLVRADDAESLDEPADDEPADDDGGDDEWD